MSGIECRDSSVLENKISDRFHGWCETARSRVFLGLRFQPF
jgi:hypothetical protein